MSDVLTADERAWIEKDDRLRARAADIAVRHGRDPEDIYHTLIQLQRTPGERLARGLRHARLHPQFR
jgi:hypothetical protein